MENNLTTINSIIDLIQWNLQRTSTRYIFRGVGHANKHKLVPKIAREGDDNIATESVIGGRMNLLWDYLDIHLPAYGIDLNHFAQSERLWRQIIIAQHYGAPTPLLDFSRNPLVALFFAVINDINEDGAIYAVPITDRNENGGVSTFSGQVNIVSFDKLGQKGDPKTFDQFVFIEPPLIDKRLAAQIGVFGFFPKQFLNLELQNQDAFKQDAKKVIKKFIVPKKLKKDLQDELNKVGINHVSLFPELEGFGKFLSWKLDNLKP